MPPLETIGPVIPRSAPCPHFNVGGDNTKVDDDDHDDNDSMLPLESPVRPAASALTPPVSAPVRAKAANDDDDSDDEVSVIEIVDLPDEESAHDGGASSPPANMARRTRSHHKPAAAAGVAVAAAATSASASAAAASAAASPCPARRIKPTGGLKTTGLESDDNITPTKLKAATAAGRKRSANDDADVGADANNDADDDTAEGAKKKEAEPHCSICLDVPSRDDVTKLNKCEHIFCFGCIETWAERENTCPLCKVRFTKIARVNKPPPSKRRKMNGRGGTKATKKIKARDQREDLVSANPLAGLFEAMEANGAMPRSIAQLLFSGLGGPSGHNPFGGSLSNGPPFVGPPPGRRRATAASGATALTSDYIVARNPTTGRFTRVPREPASASSSSQPAAAASAAPRRSTRVASSSSAAPSRSGRPAFGSAAPPGVSVTLNSYGPTSLNLPGSPPPGFFNGSFGYPRGLGGLLFHDSDDDDDEPFLPSGLRSAAAAGRSSGAAAGGLAGGGYDTLGYDAFVRRARSRAAAAAAGDATASGGEGERSSPGMRVAARREVPMPPTQAHLAPANTADTAIEIGDSDDEGGDDDEIVVLE